MKLHIFEKRSIVSRNLNWNLSGSIIYTTKEDLLNIQKEYVALKGCTHISVSRIDLDDPISNNAYIGLQQDLSRYLATELRPSEVFVLRGDNSKPPHISFKENGFDVVGPDFAPLLVMELGQNHCHLRYKRGDPFVYSPLLTTVIPVNAWANIFDYTDIPN